MGIGIDNACSVDLPMLTRVNDCDAGAFTGLQLEMTASGQPVRAFQPAIHRRISRKKQACPASEADHATLASNASRFYKLQFFA
jgi:hypothetical protein